MKIFLRQRLRNILRFIQIYSYYNATKSIRYAPWSFKGIFRFASSFYPYSLLLPKTLSIEVTNICNGKCALCPTGSGTSKRTKGFMGFENFKHLIDDVKSHVKNVKFVFAGEPLLHPQILRFIKYAESSGISIRLYTNGSSKKLRKILNTNLSTLIVSLDGLSEKVYRKYRKGLNYKKVLNNITKLCLEKKRLNLDKPNIYVQFIVMKHNEHQLNAMIRFVKNIGANGIMIKHVRLSEKSGLTKDHMINDYLPKGKKYLRYSSSGNGFLVQNPSLCTKIFTTQVLHNGDATVCCQDWDGEHVIGNVFKQGFKTVWKSLEYKSMRKKMALQQLDICKTSGCSSIEPVLIKFKDN